MIYAFYVLVILLLMALQTTIVVYLPFNAGFYDSMIPLVLYAVLFRPVREVGILIVILGSLMDTLSGGPFGIYLSTYLWIFLLVNWVTRYLQVSNSVILPFVVAAGVLLENMVALGTIALGNGHWQLGNDWIRMVSYQFLWALFTGSVMIVAIGYFKAMWEQWIVSLVALGRAR